MRCVPATEIPPAGTAQRPASAFPVGGVRYAVRPGNGDPACWRPARGAGFDCAALFGCIVRPYTRCAASLRMTRGLQGRGMENKMPYLLEK